jgi:uncharacterized membrane protein
MNWAAIFRKNVNGIYFSDVVITSAAFIVSAALISLERSLLICFLVGTVSVAINMKWRLRSQAWFWLIILLFATANALIIFTIPMPHEFKAAAGFTPLVIVEGMVLLGVISSIERRKR